MRKRRRTLGLALVLALAGCAPAVQVASAPVTASPSPTSSTPAAPPDPDGCGALASRLTLHDQIGQLLMVGMEPGATPTEALTESGVGSVILMGSWRGADQVADATSALTEIGGPVPVLVAVDQEGGNVQRLTGPGFSSIPSAFVQAGMTDEELQAAAALWGAELRDAGVALDLAPVADVVPEGKTFTKAPIGALRRGYGSDPGTVAGKVNAFIAGMAEAGVGTTVKHFPGLGAVTTNTDFGSGVVDDTIAADSELLEPFREAVAGGIGVVMVSTVTYELIDPSSPAAFSPVVVSLLRDGLGFDGVIVTDDLGAAEAAQEIPEQERLLRTVLAGVDLLITVRPDIVPELTAGLAAAAAASPVVVQRIGESAHRVLSLKSRLGLLDCRAST